MKFLINTYVKFCLWSLKKWAWLWEKVLLHCIELKGLDPKIDPEQARRDKFLKDLDWAVNHPEQNSEDYYHFMYGRDQEWSDKTKQIIESYRKKWHQNKSPFQVNFDLDWTNPTSEIVEPKDDVMSSKDSFAVTEIDTGSIDDLNKFIDAMKSKYNKQPVIETVEVTDIPTKKYKKRKAKNRNKNNKFKKVVHTRRATKTKKQKNK